MRPSVTQAHIQSSSACLTDQSLNTCHGAVSLNTHLRAIPDDLLRTAVFSGLRQKTVTELLKQMETKKYHQGETLGGKDSHERSFEVILSGAVSLKTTVERQSIEVKTLGPGEFVGDSELITSKDDILETAALSDTVTTLSMNKRQFNKLIKEHPSIFRRITSAIVDRITSAQESREKFISLNANVVHDSEMTLGQRIADGFASVMGSWKFIIVQSAILATWVTLNSIGLVNHWDPYPFICLNLLLSFQAAYAAPIIMMSQNRQSQKDRISADIDHLVNERTEKATERILKLLQDKLTKD